MMVRSERHGDATTIASIITQAFGRADEARLVARLRADGTAAISLVAVFGGDLVGHVMLSPMSAPFPALGLAPLSVLPIHQCMGIGTALVEAGLKQAKEQGWDGVFVLGDPHYYERFGFCASLARGFSSPYAGPHFMALSLGGDLPATIGEVFYASTFGDLV